MDLAADARLFPLEIGDGLPLLNATELAVDQVLAIFGRAEARDFVDLAAVVDNFGAGCLVQACRPRGSRLLDRSIRRDAGTVRSAPSQRVQADREGQGWRKMSMELRRTLGREMGRGR